MADVAQTIAGSQLSVSASLPATYDATGFQALSYTPVSDVTDLGAGLGKKYNLVVHNPVDTRRTQKFRGSYNNGTLSLKMASSTLANTDAGQTIMKAGLESDADYSFRIILQDLSEVYFTAKTMSFPLDMGTVDSILGGSVELEVNSEVVFAV
jgi:hypothetical protein